jgi:hypothetical protein
LKNFFVKCGNGLALFFRGNLNIWKLALWIFGLQMIFALFNLVMVADRENPSGWIVALSVVMTAVVFPIYFMIAKSSAYTDFMAMNAVNVRLKRGDDVAPYKRARVYKPYKGFIAGGVAMLPGLICIAAGSFTSHITTLTNGFGMAANLINLIYLIPVMNIASVYRTSMNSILVGLYGMLLAAAATGLGYLLQGLKLKAQHDSLTKNNK